MTSNELMRYAQEAKEHAYAPYSRCKVGAALLCADGTVYQGCNIENAAYGPTNCAERTAMFKAVYDGQRQFTAIAVCGGDSSSSFPPCGVCRQVLREFCQDSLLVYLEDGQGGVVTYTLGQLLPHSFGKADFVL